MSEKDTPGDKDTKEKEADGNSEMHKDDECSPRGTKRSLPDSTEELKVSSANDWEHADLGDKERKNKFLRLMGASKKEHHGKFVIGDQERALERSAEKTTEVTEGLESQYEQGIAHRLQGGRRGHIGLGFQEPDKPEEASTDDKPVSSSEDQPPQEGSTESPEQSEHCKDGENNTAPDSSMEQKASLKQMYAKLKFVKSSSTS